MGNKTLPNQPQITDAYTTIPGIGERLSGRVRALCGNRWADVLLHLPNGLTDRRNLCKVAEAQNGEMATIKVNVIAHHPSPRHQRTPWKIATEDNTGALELVFFNGGKWLEKKFPQDGEVYVSGKIEGLLTEKQMLHPESFPGSVMPAHVARLWPNYPLTAGVTQTTINKAVAESLAVMAVDSNLKHEWLPADVMTQNNWPDFPTALRQIHQPENETALDATHPARKRLAFDEMLAWQFSLAKVRASTRRTNGISHPPAPQARQDFLQSLPFTLTSDQEKVIKELDEDLMRPSPMLRLLQGDVGSGKTVVAFAAAVRAKAGGCQTAMMAPTEILASQHYLNAKNILEPLGIKTLLLTGKMKAKEKREANAAISAGEIDIVFGTHALIQKNVDFNNLSLVIIDEQHRFGVRQRLALSEKQTAAPPDVLVMTATPIPRTLALTMYGDMDISILREKPPGRTPVQTTVMPAEKLGTVIEALERVTQRGEQIYWVCPLVEESEKTDLAAATQRFEQMQQAYGDDVVLLHGRMKPTQKDQVMADFKAGVYKIMVATTVIEVGVDVPQATTMVIEHAERFGLAQLHQLRGRVGRGADKSHCILLYANPLGHFSSQRLQVMRDTDDGFEIAEKDHELRGAGETLGTQQAGHQITRIADLADTPLIVKARDTAQTLLAQTHLENDLTPEQNQSLQYLLEIFERHEAQDLLLSG